jgi:hypothetical protein
MQGAWERWEMTDLVESTRWHLYCFNSYRTEPVGVAVTFYTRIREVLSSNLGRIIGCPHWDITWLSQFLLGYAGIAPLLVHDCFLPDPFQFIIHPTIRRCRILILIASLNKPQTNELLPEGPTLYGWGIVPHGKCEYCYGVGPGLKICSNNRK